MPLSSLRTSCMITIVAVILILLYSSISDVAAGGGSYTKPLWVSSLSAHDAIDVYAGRSFHMCPWNPTKPPQHDALIPRTTDENLCWDCTDSSVPYCGPDQMTGPYCTGTDWSWNCIGWNNDCIPHTHYKRDCSPKGCGEKNAIIDGVLFPDSSAGTAKYLSCGWDVCKPAMPFIVTKDDSKTYMWDDRSPICVRSSNSAVASLGRDWITDDVLKAMVIAWAVSPTDDTLTYMDDSSIYITKQWTNRDVQAKWICSDAESGCNPLNKSILSGPLDHLQLVFAHLSDIFVDNAKNDRYHTVPANPIRDICQSNRAALSGINRSCRFQINPTKIINAITDNKKWYDNILTAGDRTYLSGVIANPPVSDSANFSSTVKKLRELSLSGSTALRTSLGITTNPPHDL